MIKKKIRYIIDEKIRFSIKSKITLSYTLMFIILSAFSTFGVLYLFNQSVENVNQDVHLTLMAILIIFNI